jgi:non-homologous end joining protein Ku
VDRDAVDPIYLDTPYYIYPDGELAVETFLIGKLLNEQGFAPKLLVTDKLRIRSSRRPPRGR